MGSSTTELSAMMYCLVMGCLNPPVHQYDLVPADQIQLDYHPVLEPVEKYSRSAPEIIFSDGYECEVHYTVTKDGFLLQMIKIVGRGPNRGTVDPVLINHGMIGFGGIWLWNGKEMSLPYMLVDLGFDVWLCTFRSAQGSEMHVSKDIESDEYWDFSYDDVAKYDVPAMIDYAREAAGVNAVTFIGYSMGGSVFLAMCNYNPVMCQEKVKLLVCIGCHTVLGNVKTPAPRFLAKSNEKVGWSEKKLGRRAVLPTPDLLRETAAMFCTKSLHSAGLCRFGLFFIQGPADLNVTRDVLGYMVSFPYTTSVKLVEQYGQFINRKKWAKFDYGPVRNLLEYGTVVPPSYSLAHVTTPVALISSKGDMMCTALDTRIMALGMPNLVFEKQMDAAKYNHMDFFLRADNIDLFKTIIELIV